MLPTCEARSIPESYGQAALIPADMRARCLQRLWFSKEDEKLMRDLLAKVKKHSDEVRQLEQLAVVADWVTLL